MKKLRWPMIALAAVSSAAALAFYDRLSALFWIPCGSILLALLSVGAALRRVPPRMERLAADSFTVYILHWPVMLGVRIVLRQLLGLSVPLTVAAMCAAGWLVPVAAAMLLRRLPLEAAAQAGEIPVRRLNMPDVVMISNYWHFRGKSQAAAITPRRRSWPGRDDGRGRDLVVLPHAQAAA